MRRLLVRSTCSALITACFALSVVTWGWMPGCTFQTPSSAHAIHAHGQQPGHSHAGGLPGSNGCTVHLCCIQLAGTGADTWGSGRLTLAEKAGGPVAESSFVKLRPSHSLPFAHAPPLTAIS
jgi:hypothetical protein